MPIRATRAVLLLLAVVGLAACASGDDATTDITNRPAVTQPRSSTTEADPVANVVERDAAMTGARQQIQLLESGDWAGAWAALHPAQQALVSQPAFATCAARRWGAALNIVEVHLVRVTKGLFDVPGTAEKQAGYRAELRIVGTDPGGEFDATTTYLEFDAGGAWRWTVKDPAAYQGGACPADDDTLT